MSQKLHLKWNNPMNIMNEFKNFLSSGTMIDVTLACDGQSLKAHKVILSACSSFFKSLFLENPCKHPIVILKDVKYTELKAILDFMYCGEIYVEATQVLSVVKIAQILKVNGLGDIEYQNDHFIYENPSGESPDYPSDNESINESVCTLDIIRNGSFVEEQSMIDENDNSDSKSEIMLIDTTKIKEERDESKCGEIYVEATQVLSVAKIAQTLKVNGLGDIEYQNDHFSYENPSGESSDYSSDNESINESVCTLDVIRNGSFVEEQSMIDENDNSKSEMMLIDTTEIKEERVLSNESNHGVSCSSASTVPFQSHEINSSKSEKDMANLREKTLSTDRLTRQSIQSSIQSNMELHQNNSDSLPSLISVTSTHVSPVQTFQSYQNNSDNMPNLVPITSTCLSPGQSFQSTALSNMSQHQNHSGNIPGSSSIISKKCIPQRQSARINKKLHQNHSDDMPNLVPVTSTCLSPGQSFQSAALSNMSQHQNHSGDIPGSLSIISKCIPQRQSARINKKLHQNHSDDMHSLSSVTSAQLNMELDQSHSNNMPSTVSVTSTCVPSNAIAIYNQQPSISSASTRRVKKKLRKLSSSRFMRALQKKSKKKEVYQPRTLRKPEILIINEVHSKKGYDKIKDSRKTNSMRKCRKKTRRKSC